MTYAPERLANEIAELRRRLAAMERGPQLARSTVSIGGEDIPVPEALSSGVTAGAAIPGLQGDLAANALAIDENVAALVVLDADLASGLGALDADLATTIDDLALAQADATSALTDAADAVLAADLARQDAAAVDSRIDVEIVPAINDAAASPVTDARLLAGSLTVWPFQADAIPAGALAPGAVASGDIADFAITVKKLKSDRHHLY